MDLKVLFHFLGAVQFFYGCFYDYTFVNVPSTTVTPFGGKLKYLTFINAMLQCLYFTLALLNDVLGNNEHTPSQKPVLRQMKDGLFSTLAFPVTMFVGTTFWSIYAIDRELVLPRRLDPYFPTWLNHVMHTNIMIFILIELFTSFRMYPRRKVGLSLLSCFMLMYLIWIHIIYFETGAWVYPLLNVLSWPMRVIFYAFNLIVVCVLYSVGEGLNKSIWSQQIEQTLKSGKKKAK